MLARPIALAALAAAFAASSCNREAGATAAEPTATPPPLVDDAAGGASIPATRLQPAVDVRTLGLDALIVAETRALERVLDLLATVVDAESARGVLEPLAVIEEHVAVLGARRRELAIAEAKPASHLAYAMQRESLSRTESRLAVALERLGAIEGVRETIEDALQPILDVYIGLAR
jgi:hypothetical protein